LLTGYYGSGVLEILNGGRVENSVGSIADQAGSKGTVTVDGVGSQWSTPGGLSVGNAGAGTLNLRNGGVVSAGATHLGSRGVVNLDGGALHVGETSAVAGALFNWISGTLHLAGAGGGSLADGLLGALGGVLSLRPGMSLRVDHTLTVAAGNVLVLNGGQLVSGALALDGGTIVAGAGGANFRDTGNLTGHGTVAGSVIGGSGRTIIASGGTLTMGNAGLLDGFNFDGHLYTGSNQVILLSAGRARLGETTTLDGGARLVTINGADLRFGQRLLFNGDASIAGALNSNGRVIGTGGILSFLGDVSGAGDFTGNFFFHAGHSPGNSPAIVNFNGGNVTYGDAASLTLELFGPRAGAQYDQLLGINALTFNGRLRLLFGNGFVPDAGSHFALLGFNTFSGSLAPERISVAGFDASRLDYSRLGIDGTLSVTAVPEPGAQVMLLAGLVMMGLIVRRRRGHSR
jgi:T5SS/PEP-CTERM-associated repeat protein